MSESEYAVYETVGETWRGSYSTLSSARHRAKRLLRDGAQAFIVRYPASPRSAHQGLGERLDHLEKHNEPIH